MAPNYKAEKLISDLQIKVLLSSPWHPIFKKKIEYPKEQAKQS